MPTCWAICDCVNPSKKRRWRIVRSRSSRTRNPGASTARDAHGPALVAEVALDLPDDVRRRVSGQLDTPVDVETVDRLDQPDRADLDEVIELLASIRVPPRERTDERHVPLDQLLARLQVAILVVAAKQHLVRLAERLPPFALLGRLVSSTHCEPSRSSISTESQTALRIRPRFSEFVPPSSSSARTELNGPTIVRSPPPSASTRRVTSRPSLGRSSSES